MPEYYQFISMSCIFKKALNQLIGKSAKQFILIASNLQSKWEKTVYCQIFSKFSSSMTTEGLSNEVKRCHFLSFGGKWTYSYIEQMPLIQRTLDMHVASRSKSLISLVLGGIALLCLDLFATQGLSQTCNKFSKSRCQA